MISEKDIKDYAAQGFAQPSPKYAPNQKYSANDIQHGGTHYKQFKGFEPWDVITAWDLGYLEGTALKYIARWKHKNGVEDLKKAVHFLQKKIEIAEAKRAAI